MRIDDKVRRSKPIGSSYNPLTLKKRKQRKEIIGIDGWILIIGLLAATMMIVFGTGILP